MLDNPFLITRSSKLDDRLGEADSPCPLIEGKLTFEHSHAIDSFCTIHPCLDMSIVWIYAGIIELQIRPRQTIIYFSVRKSIACTVPQKAKRCDKLDKLPWSIAIPLVSGNTRLLRRMITLSPHTWDWSRHWMGMFEREHPWGFHNSLREMFQSDPACKTKTRQRFVPEGTVSWRGR